MAEKKKKPEDNYQRFKKEIQDRTLGRAYILHGEESYLREYYRARAMEALVPPAFAAFNYHREEGIGVPRLAELLEAMPMMAERTVVEVRDWDLFKLNERQRTELIALLSDLPDHCCLLLVYDLVAYAPNRTMRKLCKALEDNVVTVRFDVQDKRDLTNWVVRRFKAAGKEIGRQEVERLLLTCGSLMNALIPEIEKIAAYAKGPRVTMEDIDAVAAPVLAAQVFDMTGAVSRGDLDQAAEILSGLLAAREEPIELLAAIGKELRRLYTARIAIDNGWDRGWFMEQWSIRSDYVGRLLMQNASRVTTGWCQEALRRCQALDLRMKSVAGVDNSGELRQFLMELGT